MWPISPPIRCASNGVMKPVPPLRVVARHSPRLAAFTVIASLSTAMLLLMLPMPWWCQTALIACTLAAGGVRILRDRHGHPCELIIGMDRRCQVLRADGRAWAGQVLDATYVTGFFTAVVWRPEGARLARTCALPGDAMPGDDLRRLRVWLRFAQPPRGDPVGVGAGASSSDVTAGPPASHAAASMRAPLSALG